MGSRLATLCYDIPMTQAGSGYYEDAAFYDATARGVPGDIEFYRDLGRSSGGPVVELGVGTGRIAIPTAQTGVEVTGIDLAPAMLEVARRRAEEAGVGERLHLLEGDMRTFTVSTPVPLVTIPFRTFLHNLSEDDQHATLRAARRALRPGGRLALNVFNPDLARIARWMGKGPRYEEPFDAAGRVAAHHDYRPEGHLVTSRLRWRDEAGRVRRATLTLRYVFREEMAGLLAEAGFEVETLHGDFQGAAFREASPEMVWIARRIR